MIYIDPCELNPYVLPTIDFVGGATEKLSFNTFFRKNKEPFSLSGCTAQFSVISFTNKNGEPIISKAMGTTSGNGNVLTVDLISSDTLEMCGKYIYQITIKDGSNNTEIPKQGLMYITNNIDKNFLRTS